MRGMRTRFFNGQTYRKRSTWPWASFRSAVVNGKKKKMLVKKTNPPDKSRPRMRLTTQQYTCNKIALRYCFLFRFGSYTLRTYLYVCDTKNAFRDGLIRVFGYFEHKIHCHLCIWKTVNTKTRTVFNPQPHTEKSISYQIGQRF